MTRTESMNCYKILELMTTEEHYYLIEPIDNLYRLVRVAVGQSRLRMLDHERFADVAELRKILVRENLLRWVPRDNQIFWTIDFSQDGLVDWFRYDDINSSHKTLLKLGLCFKSKNKARYKAELMLDIIN